MYVCMYVCIYVCGLPQEDSNGTERILERKKRKCSVVLEIIDET